MATIKVKTKNLIIRTASDDEMRDLIANEKDKELHKAYSEMLDLSIKHQDCRHWYATWFIELLNGERIGDLCFKGLSSNGTTEVGYGLLTEYHGHGYATEAVKAVTEWALNQPGVRCIEAEAEENNIASLRVLEKSGFIPTGEKGNEGLRFMKRDKGGL